MRSLKSKEFAKLAESKLLLMQQKEGQIRDCIITLKSNPKFIKLLSFAMNNLEKFISFPNREIKINANIIIKQDGVIVLKATSSINIGNEEIVQKTGDIMWKLIAINEIVDHDLAKQFSDKGGHEAVIEILLSGQKSTASKPYVKILNGLSQIPYLVQRLIDGGVIETCKLINDIFIDDPDLITTNLEIMKKISNLKSGREFLLQKDLIPNLLKNIDLSARLNNIRAVLAGMTILDNLSRLEEAKDSLMKNNVIEQIAFVSELLDYDDKVLQMNGKILSRISKTEDMIKELKNLETFYLKKEYSDCIIFHNIVKPIIHSTKLISSFMLVEDLAKLLNSPENFDLIISIFEDIKNIDLTDKSCDFTLNYLKLNKDFMIIFNRIFEIIPELLNNNKLIENMYNVAIKNFQKLRNLIGEDYQNEESIQLIKQFIYFFSSFTDIYGELYKDKIPEQENIMNLLKIIIDGNKFLRFYEKFNNSSSKILIISDLLDDMMIQNQVYELINYMKDVVNFSENQITLYNILNVLFSQILKLPEKLENIADKILDPILNFMTNKPKLRQPNYLNFKILDKISNNQYYIDLIKQSKPLDLISPVVSVLTKNNYTTTEVIKIIEIICSSEKHSEKKEEDIEINIMNYGLKLLEKFVDKNELKKRIKTFKDLANSYSPALYSNETITKLENSLLFFISILRIKSFFIVSFIDIFDIMKNLIIKEVQYIESIKKEKPNDNNSNLNELIKSSSSRLKMQMGVVIIINDNCINNYKDATSEDLRIPYANTIKEINNSVIQFFEKSTDLNNIRDSVYHLHKNLDFLIEQEQNINANPPAIHKKKSILGIDHKFDFIKFEDSILEKNINILNHLLRKFYSEDNLCIDIISTFLTIILRKRIEACDILVKAGCPRILLQIIEITSNKKLVCKALELIKFVTFSSEENLEMFSNQNIIYKLNDTYSKFINDNSIVGLVKIIINELVRLPGQEKFINEIINHKIMDIKETMKDDKYEEKKEYILSDLEILNTFTSNHKFVGIMVDTGFINIINQLIVLAVQEKESNNNENLIVNEMFLLKKITDEIKDICPNLLGEILMNFLKIIMEKPHYRDLFLNSLKYISGFITNDEVFEKQLKDKFETKFIDQLFNVQENYIDDLEVCKEINNFLCNLCLKSEVLTAEISKYKVLIIVKRGGLANVMEDLKISFKLNDEFSNNLKYNGLKLINSICKEKCYLEKFLDANGADLVLNIMKYELKYMNSIKREIFQYLAYDSYNFRLIMNISEENNNQKIIELLKLIKKIIKYNSSTFEPNLFYNIIEILDKNYPNKYIYKNGIKILTNYKNQIYELNLKFKKELIQMILSYNSFFISDSKINDCSVLILKDITYTDDRLNEIIRFFGCNNEGNDSELQLIFETNDNVTLFLCYFGLYTEFDINGIKNAIDFKDYSFFIEVLLNKLLPNINNEGGLLAVIKILKNFLLINVESKNYLLNLNNKFHQALLKIGLTFYNPSNYNFIYKFLNEFQQIFDITGFKINDKITDVYLIFIENIYLRSFEIIDFYINLLNTIDPINPIFEETLSLVLKFVTLYLSQEGNENYVNSSIKKLSHQCETILKNQNIDDKTKALPFWEILYYLQLRDGNNLINSNDELTNFLLNRIIETIPKYDNEILRKNLNELTKKIELDRDYIEKISNFVNSDLDKNLLVSNEMEIINVRNDFNSLNNIIKFPITSKIILKNSQLTNKLIKIYEDHSQDILTNLFLSNIIKHLTDNTINNYEIHSSNPKFISNILSYILTRNKPNTNFEVEILDNELVTFINLIKYDFKDRLKNNDLSENDLKFICQSNLDHPICGSNFKEILDTINSINQEKDSIERLRKDKEFAYSLNEDVNKIFKKDLSEKEYLNYSSFKSQNMVRLSSNLIRPSINSNQRTSTSRLSKDERNSNLPKLKNVFSVKDNPDSLNKIDQILELILRLNQEINNEKSDEIIAQKEIIIASLFTSLKLFSNVSDNHQTILEMGLLKFMEKITENKLKSNKFYIESLEICKNCTTSENAIFLFMESPISSYIIKEVIELYENTETITSNQDKKAIFIQSNGIFSNLCRNKKGFDYLFDKIGLENLLNIGKLTTNEDILSAVLQILVNYIKNDDHDISNIIGDILTILNKCLEVPKKSCQFATSCFLLGGMIYCEELNEIMQSLSLVQRMSEEFDNHLSSPELLSSILFCLGRITVNNNVNSKEAISGGILHKIQYLICTWLSNEALIENITALFGHLILNNLDNLLEFCRNDLSISILLILENYIDSNHINVLNNCIVCLDQIAMVDEGIIHLSKTNFQDLLLKVFLKKSSEPELIKNCLHCLGYYLNKDLGNNVKKMNFDQILLLLIFLQKNFYSNSDILININCISGYLINILKDKLAKEKLFLIIVESIKIQDWNVQLIVMTVKLIHDILKSESVEIDNIFEQTVHSIFILLRNHNDQDILIFSYNIIALFSKFFVLAWYMVNNGLVELIKVALETNYENKAKFKIRGILIEILGLLSKDAKNSKIISEVVMNKLILDLNCDEFASQNHEILKIICIITKHRNCIEPFVQHNGISVILSEMEKSSNNVSVIFDCFEIIKNMISGSGSEEYKRILYQKKVPDIINHIIDKSLYLDKKIEIEGRILIFNINSFQFKKEIIEEKKVKLVNSEFPIKEEITNYLIAGKIVNLYKENGDKRKLNLFVTADLNMIICKEPGNNIIPKPKNTINTLEIKRIIQGYGTKSFEKHKGLFKKPPRPEKCFSIIGEMTVNGEKSINIECETAEEASKWIESLEMVANFIKNKYLKSFQKN